MSYDTGKGFKICNKRFRLHAGAPKAKETGFQVVPEFEKVPNILATPPPGVCGAFVSNFPIKSNIFKNVTITPDALKQNLPSYSKKDESNFKVKELKESIIQEIGQGKRRKIPFHEVVASAKDFLKKREQEKKKASTAILGNFDALEEALPVLDQLVEENKKEDKTARASKPFAKQDAEMMEDLQTYQQTLTNTVYMADPFGSVTALLRRRLQAGMENMGLWNQL